MKNYISLEDLRESIDYFKSKDIAQGEMFYFFLILKSLGFNENLSNDLAVSKMEESKKDILKSSLYLLGGTFNHFIEECQKYDVSFPAGILALHSGSLNDKVIFYQPASSINNLSRVHDTIKNFRGVKFYEYDDNNNSVTFKTDYLDIISRDYLRGDKISLRQIISWTFKFNEFETTEKISPIQFTLMLKKHFIKTFKLTKRELSKLFIDDLYANPLNNNDKRITGEDFRTYSGLKRFLIEHKQIDYVQNYKKKSTEEQTYQYDFSKSSVNDIILQQSGENLSPGEVKETLINQKQIILTGVPGTGKSFYTQEIGKSDFFNGEKAIIQFHPNYTYEDFIGGDILTVADGSTTTKSKNGVFLEFIKQAQLEENKDKNHLFIIDEINRGSIANIFGETILMLDREYTVDLAQPIENTTKIRIPENVYIIGTMNTSDRNIAFLDLAIRRRFAFIPLVPNYEFLTENIRIENQNEYNMGAILKFINEKIVEVLKNDNLILGQSYFIPNNGTQLWTEKEFQIQFNYGLIPTLKEYSYNQPNLVHTIVGDLADQVHETDAFYERFYNQFGEFIL